MIGRVALTGQVIEERCTEQEVCINETITLCDKECITTCTNQTEEICNPITEEVCEKVCIMENETEICNDVCQNVEKEICEEITKEICEEVCNDVNCTEKIVENCSTETICKNVTIEEIPTETPVEETEEITETIVKEETITPEIQTKSIINYTLSNEEINSVKEKTGDILVKTTKSEIINDRLVIRLEIGNFWIENSYDYPNSEEEIKKEIELNKIKLLKQIAGEVTTVNNEQKGEFLVNYEI